MEKVIWSKFYAVNLLISTNNVPAPVLVAKYAHVRAHMLTVNLVSSQPVTPCRCFWFHGGGCTCVTPEQEEVKAGEGAAPALEEELEISVRSNMSGQVRCLHMLLKTLAWSAMCGGEWRGWAPVKWVSVCDGCLPAHAMKLQFSLQAGASGLNLAVLFLDVKTAARCIYDAYNAFWRPYWLK